MACFVGKGLCIILHLEKEELLLKVHLRGSVCVRAHVLVSSEVTWY